MVKDYSEKPSRIYARILRYKYFKEYEKISKSKNVEIESEKHVTSQIDL